MGDSYELFDKRVNELDLDRNIELECKILTLRDRLNDSILDGKDYDYIYKVSCELDKLIEKYYRENSI